MLGQDTGIVKHAPCGGLNDRLVRLRTVNFFSSSSTPNVPKCFSVVGGSARHVVTAHAGPRTALQSATSARRTFLSSLLSLPFCVPSGTASVLRSLASDQPCTLAFFNKTSRDVKVYWINYDADMEFFVMMPPNGKYTIDSFVSHAWSIVDAETGALLQQYTATEGFQLVPIQETSGNKQGGAADRLPFTGWDGLGQVADAYAPAKVIAVSVGLNGGVASLTVEGFSAPLDVAIGLSEAAALLYASGLESRRPSTLKAWQQSLDVAGAGVERVVLTRIVGQTCYSRIVLSLGSGRMASVDARPDDSLALALQSKRPVFVAKTIAMANEEEVSRLAEEEEEGLQGLDSPFQPQDAAEVLDVDEPEMLQTA